MVDNRTKGELMRKIILFLMLIASTAQTEWVKVDSTNIDCLYNYQFDFNLKYTFPLSQISFQDDEETTFQNQGGKPNDNLLIFSRSRMSHPAQEEVKCDRSAGTTGGNDHEENSFRCHCLVHCFRSAGLQETSGCK